MTVPGHCGSSGRVTITFALSAKSSDLNELRLVTYFEFLPSLSRANNSLGDSCCNLIDYRTTRGGAGDADSYRSDDGQAVAYKGLQELILTGTRSESKLMQKSGLHIDEVLRVVNQFDIYTYAYQQRATPMTHEVRTSILDGLLGGYIVAPRRNTAAHLYGTSRLEG